MAMRILDGGRRLLKQRYLCRVLALLAISACSSPTADTALQPASWISQPSDGFTNFETEPVRPLALSPDGRFLYALNTADDRLEIFDAQGDSLRSIGETAVGLRPVALALRGEQAWVVNHLSDSVSIVDIRDPRRPRVVRTLQVGDEPRDIVVAGRNRERIFVAAARRGESLTPGIGRAQLWIFDATRPEASPQILTLFGTKPRALAASIDGHYVYAGIFHSGNGTATVSGEAAVRLGRARQLYFPDIPYAAVPKQGAIVRRDGGRWRDYGGRDWSAAVPFELPDYDLFAIDAAAAASKVVRRVSGVGTVIFNLAVQPGSGEIWASNTEAFNLMPHEPRLQGRFAANRIARIAPARRYIAETVELNPHIDPETADVSEAGRERSLAQPLELVFQPDGSEAYVAAFGSGKIGVLDRSGRVIDRIAVGFGPAGLALDAARQRLYVLNRLDSTISIVDPHRRRILATVPLRYNPTPDVVKRGRRFFYDAGLSSRHGNLSCATCHVFGDKDGVAWDLGDPNGPTFEYPVSLRNTGLAAPRQLLHPLKGPMVTQSLRGLAGSAPYHWRGDRFGNPLGPGGDIASFKDFNPAFVDLLGRSQPLPDSAMDAFARFVMTIRYPPNPNQPLDRSLDPQQQAGFDFFTGPFLSDTGEQNCVSCHVLPLGTNRLINFEGPQIGRDMKTAHLRNLYDKVGRFNLPGPQVSGFGLLHDGAFDTIINFLRLEVFFFPGNSEEEKDATRRALESYLMGFDTGMAPAVGRQLTVSGKLAEQDRGVVDLLIDRANAGDCDLIAKGWEGGLQRGWLLRGMAFVADRREEHELRLDELVQRYIARDEPLTFTCVPPGDGRRSALDRDRDGRLDGDQLNSVALGRDGKAMPAPR